MKKCFACFLFLTAFIFLLLPAQAEDAPTDDVLDIAAFAGGAGGSIETDASLNQWTYAQDSDDVYPLQDGYFYLRPSITVRSVEGVGQVILPAINFLLLTKGGAVVQQITLTSGMASYDFIPVDMGGGDETEPGTGVAYKSHAFACFLGINGWDMLSRIVREQAFDLTLATTQGELHLALGPEQGAGMIASLTNFYTVCTKAGFTAAHPMLKNAEIDYPVYKTYSKEISSVPFDIRRLDNIPGTEFNVNSGGHDFEFTLYNDMSVVDTPELLVMFPDLYADHVESAIVNQQSSPKKIRPAITFVLYRRTDLDVSTVSICVGEKQYAFKPSLRPAETVDRDKYAGKFTREHFGIRFGMIGFDMLADIARSREFTVIIEGGNGSESHHYTLADTNNNYVEILIRFYNACVEAGILSEQEALAYYENSYPANVADASQDTINH